MRRGRVDDPAACGERSGKTLLDLLASNGHVDMHRMSQWLGWVKILHPDHRSVAERVDGVVVGHPGVPEGSAPEANIDRIWLRRDGERHLLRTRAVDDGSVRPRHRRDRSSQLRRAVPRAAIGRGSTAR